MQNLYNRLKSNKDFIGSVKFFSLIYAFCLFIPIYFGIAGAQGIEGVVIVSFGCFLFCYIPYIVIKFLRYLLFGFEWSYDKGFQFIPIIILLGIIALMFE